VYPTVTCEVVSPLRVTVKSRLTVPLGAGSIMLLLAIEKVVAGDKRDSRASRRNTIRERRPTPAGCFQRFNQRRHKRVGTKRLSA
jgi:hypothetical protein